MMNSLFEAALSNAVIALPLALIAILVSLKTRQPKLSYMLWLLVLLKLVTPPIVFLPVAILDQPEVVAIQPIENDLADHSIAAAPSLMFDDTVSLPEATSESWSPFFVENWQTVKTSLIVVWCAGTLLLLLVTLTRVFRFNCLINQFSRPAHEYVQVAAKEIAASLNLSKVPTILAADADVSPLVWWVGMDVKIVFPNSLLEKLTEEQWRMVLAHELAHVKRRDYFVRWLEWFAGAVFWWNPVMRWARHHLRAAEEICCDLLVLSRLKPDPHEYANSLLVAVESLVCPAYRPPAVASEINGGGNLERRFRMLVSDNMKRPITRGSWVLVLVLALVALPFGMVSAQNFRKVEQKLERSVQKGHLSELQAKAMLETLHRMSEGEGTTTRGVWIVEEKGAAAKTRGGWVLEEKSEKTSNDWIQLDGTQAKGVEIRRGAERRMEAATKRVNDAIASGDLSHKEGLKKLAAVRESIAAAVKAMENGSQVREATDNREGTLAKLMNSDRNAKAKLKLKEAVREIRIAVANGELNRAEAREKMQAMEKQRASAKKQVAEYEAKRGMEEAEHKIREAVFSGGLSKEEARKKIAAVQDKIVDSRKRMAEYKKQAETYLQDASAKLMEAASNGEISEEEARGKLETIRKKLRERMAGQRETKNEGVAKNGETRLRIYGEKLRQAVADKIISDDEAKQKFEAASKRFGSQGSGGGESTSDEKKGGQASYEDLREIGMKIREAVRNGEVTKEQAREKMEAIRKKLADSREKEGGDRRRDK